MQLELTLLAILGFLVSLYAIMVEKNISKNKKYKPLCDINERISCSKALTSNYGKTFNVKNSIFGIFYYLIILILTYLNQIRPIFYLSIIAVFGSLYLAYLSYVKLKTLCIVCNTIYLVNILLLIISYLAL